MSVISGLDRKAYSKFKSECWDGKLIWRDRWKQDHREVVMRYFASTQQRQKQTLSFPGTSWDFENAVLQRFNHRLVCIERHAGIFDYCKRLVPGDRRHDDILKTPVGEYRQFKSDNCTYINADFQTLLRGRASKRYFDSRNQKRLWHTIKNNTSIWFDGMSTATSAETATIAPRIAGWTRRRTKTVPLAYTICGARDCFSSDEHRVKTLVDGFNSSYHRTFILDEVFRHIGNGSVPMLTLLGRLING